MRRFLLATMLAACGGEFQNAPGADAGGVQDDASVDDGGATQDGGGTSDGGRPDAGNLDAAPAPPCPASAPLEGSKCDRPDFYCEYGASADPKCNALVRCGSNGWEYESKGTTCMTPGSSTCPSTRAAITAGTLCQAKQQICEYPTGGCYCSAGLGGPVTDEFRWHCRDRDTQCPIPRPRYGAPCNAAGKQCSYGECLVVGGTLLKCTAGYWQPDRYNCPL
jgi:hypothetical protein